MWYKSDYLKCKQGWFRIFEIQANICSPLPSPTHKILLVSIDDLANIEETELTLDSKVLGAEFVISSRIWRKCLVLVILAWSQKLF